ncbi:MAG: SIMPL domain-containing protein [Chloroflexi bacterium]|nr:SIMPL domain-containing protein [Chloroflexota bacterium]
MKTKTMFISLTILIAVFLSACGPIALPVSSASQTTPRALTVSGAGKVSLKPDIAYIYVGIHTEKPGAAEAVAENNTNTQKLIDALKTTGVDANDIQTTNFSIWQNTQYGPDGKPSSANYAVDNTVYLTVRNLGQLGDLLDAAVKAGANNINSIQFDVADKTKALSAARTEAVKTAKQQADELAAAAGVKLGDIQSIQYTDGSPSPIFQGKGMGAGGAVAADVAVPINPGQMEITVTVTMSYEIK